MELENNNNSIDRHDMWQMLRELQGRTKNVEHIAVIMYIVGRFSS